MSRSRGNCRACGKSVLLRADGTARHHHARRYDRKRCPGSWRHPRADEAAVRLELGRVIQDKARIVTKGLVRMTTEEAVETANVVVLELERRGIVLADRCVCSQPLGTCECGDPRCWRCDPGDRCDHPVPELAGGGRA